MRRDFDKAVAITAIHPELGHVDIVWKRHWLDRLITDPRIFWRDVIPRGRGQSADDQNSADRHLQRQPVAPAWKEICHKISGRPASPDTAATLETNSRPSQDVRTSMPSLYESKFRSAKENSWVAWRSKIPGDSSSTEKSPFRKMITSKLRGSVK